ncbi:MAG: hypothetical protein AAFY41_11010 [Bacteroidota bacterium]
MILISVKLLENGIVSHQLAKAANGDWIKGSFKKNPNFHFPKKANSVLLIANGTGIAPFLGMLNSNRNKPPTTLFWGGRNEASFDLYKPTLARLKKDEKLMRVEIAYSRTESKPKYVQQLVKENEKLITSILEHQGIIMICGSLNMQQGVEEALDQISKNSFNKSIDYFIDLGLVKADCY